MSLIDKSVLQLLVDPKVRGVSIPHMEAWMFDEPYDCIFRALADDKYHNKVPDHKSFVIELHTNYSVDQEGCQLAIDILVNAESAPPDRIDEVTQSLNDFVQEKRLARGVEQMAVAETPNHKKQGLDSIRKAINLAITSDEFVDFTDIDSAHRAKEEDYPVGGRIIQSSFQVYNQASLHGGHKYGDLVMFAAKTGVGKTTATIQEAANAVSQGFKVAHLFLGDMSEFDALVRYLAIWTGKTTRQTIEYYEKFLRIEEIHEKFSRTRIKAVEGSTFTILEVLSKLSYLYDNFEYDLLVVDYDSNILPMTDNMYTEGGTTYGMLKGFSKGRCATIILSQTKPHYWDKEVVPLEAPVESSKKQHNIDAMVGVGVNQESPIVGTINIAKMRRGTTNVQSRIHFQYANARVREVRQDRYDHLAEQYREEKEREQHSIEIDSFEDDA